MSSTAEGVGGTCGGSEGELRCVMFLKMSCLVNFSSMARRGGTALRKALVLHWLLTALYVFFM